MAAATVKVRNFFAIREVLEELGFSPGRILAAIGLDPDLFANREAVVLYNDAANDAARLVAACARETGCDDFGLRAGSRAKATATGLTGLVSLNAPTVRDALRIVSAGLTSDTGGVFNVAERKGLAYLSYVLIDRSIEGADQAVDYSMAVVANMMRQFCGKNWRPAQVLLSRRPPADPKRFRQFFGAPVEFDAAVGQLVCAAADLDLPVQTRDPEYEDILSPLLDAAVAESADPVVAEVRAVLKALAGGGRLNSRPGRGNHGRQRARRLAAAGASFADLRNEAKFELARRMLLADKPLRAITSKLGFADSSAFSRAFAKWSGHTPGKWRARRARVTVARK